MTKETLVNLLRAKSKLSMDVAHIFERDGDQVMSGKMKSEASAYDDIIYCLTDKKYLEESVATLNVPNVLIPEEF